MPRSSRRLRVNPAKRNGVPSARGSGQSDVKNCICNRQGNDMSVIIARERQPYWVGWIFLQSRDMLSPTRGGATGHCAVA